MEKYREAFGCLNKKQLEAVKAIEGPVLVIAGPGTGKTQLISTRVGYILRETDTLPANILLLTFTEAGVAAMRERLSGLLGQEAYEVQISTYHAFGNELLRRNPEYFDDVELSPVDELGAITLLQEQIRRLPYGNPMKFMSEHARDVLGFISDAKRALLAPEDVMAGAEANIRFINQINKEAKSALLKITTLSKKSAPLFASLQLFMETLADKHQPPKNLVPLCVYALGGLKEAVSDFTASGSTKSLTQWKNTWLAKDRDGNFIFGGLEQNRKLLAAGELYSRYQNALKRRRLYDYDDMILRTIGALEANPEFKYSLAEQYFYIMLDEFQDTNPAQMRLIELLTDHPALERQPNILAVGDDDQAVYAFQGADHGNMLRLARHYDKVKIINLEDNYRSHPDVLVVGMNIAAQIEERLHHSFEAVDKKLMAAGKGFPAKAVIAAREFKSDAAQYEWVSEEIDKLISKHKIPAGEIAVLAPKHRYLMPLMPYLARKKIPVRYEKRENILEAAAVRQLERMSRLTLALAAADSPRANSLWPEILSYDFWGLTTEKLWRISWLSSEGNGGWLKTLLADKDTRDIALLFLRLKDLLTTTTLEQQLDGLMGVDNIAATLDLPMTSPFAGFYFGRKAEKDPAAFVGLLSNLSLLRFSLRAWRADEDAPMSLSDFIEFVDAHRSAGLGIVDSSPYSEADSSVNLMTAYGAKGREFKAVFILSALDSVWGSASRNAGSRISLPANLRFIRYQGASEDERLRLLFVAATRAKTHLYFSLYSKSLSGRPAARLKYLDVYEDGGKLRAHVLPDGHDEVLIDSGEALSLEALKDYWIDRHTPPFAPKLKRLLAPRLEKFLLSPSRLNQFTDVTSGGPRAFFVSSVLGFPPAPTATAIYGSAIHETIRWHLTGWQAGQKPEVEPLLARFERELKSRRLPEGEHKLLLERGRLSLAEWHKKNKNKPSEEDKLEYGFRADGVFVGDGRLSGKIDWLKLDKSKRTAVIVDFKTGQPYRRWDNRAISLYRYRQQLLMYKLLVENSPRFSGYKVEQSFLEFIEPDSDGEINRLELIYEEAEVERLKKLVQAVWKMVRRLEFPNTDNYPASVAGIKAFEEDILSGA